MGVMQFLAPPPKNNMVVEIGNRPHVLVFLQGFLDLSIGGIPDEDGAVVRSDGDVLAIGTEAGSRPIASDLESVRAETCTGTTKKGNYKREMMTMGIKAQNVKYEGQSPECSRHLIHPQIQKLECIVPHAAQQVIAVCRREK